MKRIITRLSERAVETLSTQGERKKSKVFNEILQKFFESGEEIVIKKKKTIGLIISEEHYNKLREIAKKYKTDINNVIEMIIEWHSKNVSHTDKKSYHNLYARRRSTKRGRQAQRH